MSAANAKPDQLRPVPRHNVNKENESNEDTEPRHCRNILLAAALCCTHSFVETYLSYNLTFHVCICEIACFNSSKFCWGRTSNKFSFETNSINFSMSFDL